MLGIPLGHPGAAEQPGTGEAPRIAGVTVPEAHQLIQQHQGRTDLAILDVRTPAEFAAGHLAGALNVDFRAAEFEAKLGKLDRAKSYLIYCRVGHRSGNALPIFKRLGFVSVFDMQGGITEWARQGLPVEPAPAPSR